MRKKLCGRLGVLGCLIVAGCGQVEPDAASKTALPAQASAAPEAASTPDASGQERYDHPLTWQRNRALIEQYFRDRPGATSQDFARDYMVVAGERALGEGAPSTKLTGILPVQRRPIAGHVPSLEPEAPALSIGPQVQAWLDNVASRPGGLVKLSLGLFPNWNHFASVPNALRLAMIEGTLRTQGDARRVREAVLRDKQRAGTLALLPLQNAVVGLGGRVLSSAPRAGTMDVLLPISALDTLVTHPMLGRIETTSVISEDAGIAYDVDGTKIDGRELEDLLQTTHAYDRGYLGDYDERIALVEGGGANVFNDHQGFDGRYTNCGDDGAGACDWAHPTTGTAHATATASILLGDITRGQDAAISDDLEQRMRSGVARDSRGRGFTGAFQFLSDRLFAYNDTYLLTQSASANDDPNCRGETTLSRNWNSLYEDGYALFNSAGNNGHGTAGDCTVASPATAIGVFTVGAYVINSSDAEEIYSASDRGGGTASEGRHRTIINVVAPSGMEYAYPHYAWPEDSSGTPYEYGVEWASIIDAGPGSFCCTSSSTPTVTGSAAIFREWFNDIHGSMIDDPGLLYTNLLLMGDRQNESVVFNDKYRSTGFDDLWGAGKFRLRLFDLTGLDEPATWSSGAVCVDDGTDVFIDMGSMSDDVEILNSVLWWYDRRHDDGTHHDNIDLEVQRSINNLYTTQLSSATRDNKERVALERPEPGTYRLKIHGQRVTADDEGCGANSMLVYFAYVAEDGDREAWENLSDVRPYPLDLELDLIDAGTISLP